MIREGFGDATISSVSKHGEATNSHKKEREILGLNDHQKDPTDPNKKDIIPTFCTFC